MTIKSVRALLRDRPLHSVGQDDSVAEACAALETHNIGALAVLDHGTLVGILSERDIIRTFNARGRNMAATPVSDVMTTDVQVAYIDDPVAEALTTMTEGGFRHMPVVDDEGAPVAMLSMRDIPTEHRLMLERYQDYIAPSAGTGRHAMSH